MSGSNAMTASLATVLPSKLPKLFARQRYLLSLLGALGGSKEASDFQVLLFLACQEVSGEAPPYDFVPGPHGPCSFTAEADRGKLIDRGLLEDVGHWELTEAGRSLMDGLIAPEQQTFARRHRALRGDALAAHTFHRFPFFATRSELAREALSDDAAALARTESLRSAATGNALSTIGYEGHSLESYLTLLLKSGVTVLCDVRRNPISRKYGFSKTALGRGCERVGIRYVHLPELGIASEHRKSLETQADYDALFDAYERVWLPQQQESLATIGAWLAAGERVTLTCYEHLPQQCHRHCVADALRDGNGRGYSASHL